MKISEKLNSSKPIAPLARANGCLMLLAILSSQAQAQMTVLVNPAKTWVVQ